MHRFSCVATFLWAAPLLYPKSVALSAELFERAARSADDFRGENDGGRRLSDTAKLWSRRQKLFITVPEFFRIVQLPPNIKIRCKCKNKSCKRDSRRKELCNQGFVERIGQ